MYEFKVEGMTCSSCRKAIKNTLEQNEPNVDVYIDIRNQAIHVDSKRSIEEVAKSIEQAGYPVLGAITKNTKEAL